MSLRPVRCLAALVLALALAPQPSHTGFPPLAYPVPCGSSVPAVTLNQGYEVVLGTYATEEEADDVYENTALLQRMQRAFLNAITSYFECDRCSNPPPAPPNCARSLAFSDSNAFSIEERQNANGEWEIVLVLDATCVVSVVCAEC